MGNLESADNRQDAASLLKSLIEEKTLEKWQQHFCDVTNVFMCCVDSSGFPLTEFGGNEEEKNKIKRIIDGEQLSDMLLRVSESTLEDQAIETTAYPNVRLAVISAKMGGKPFLNWLVCGVLSDAEDLEEYENPPLEGFTNLITRKQFSKVVDTLRSVTDTMLKYRFSAINAQAESRRIRYSEKEMSENLKRSEALAEIVQFLESDESVENVMHKLLKTVGELLNLSIATLYGMKKDNVHVDFISRWCKKNVIWEFEKDGEHSAPELLIGKKTLVLSQNSMLSVSEREQMQALGFKAVIVMPVEIKGASPMYVCFGEMVRERNWKLEEIKFLSDCVKILRSILTKSIQKESLLNSNASLETILDNVGSSVYVRKLTTGEILFTNRSMRNIFGQELKDGSMDKMLDDSVDRESGSREIYFEKKDCWYDLYYIRMKWMDGNPAILCALYDVTDKKIFQKKTEQQAYTDFLTGIYNRMSCERDLAKYVDEAEKSKTQGALLYLDLDDFKHINDGLGHKYGDVLLKSISHSFQRIEGIKNTCYRMGGDEFVIIIPPAEYENSERIIGDIREIFMRPWFLKNSDYYCTMSMGVVEFPAKGDEVNDLIKKADIAMYEAKKKGKNRIAYYSDNIKSKSSKRLDMEKSMRDATAKGYQGFEVYYQPIIDISKKELPCTGAEALIRWNNADLGFIPPSEFIPLAEYLGLINPIGNFVLKEACSCCKNWNDHGYPDYKVNVNLSVVQLLQPDIVEIIENIVKETGIVPKNLTLEVTESLAINDMERMQEILDSIKKLGVRIALDDFGTGYSSLNHIREIPFDVIKVDQSFITDLERDEYAKSFIRMVGELAEAIGVNVCIEGVETKKQYEILSEMCVLLAQGYYFDRPMDQQTFEKKYTPDLKRKPRSKRGKAES
ncbi:MAG: bifunctional diguanylate cyclase/phosphodiesterase [Lachnospiraceae bacterium]|nr:bifunctional diguanylate cyclase/phosphodiesterase [Lachnospiraceae bacterium]